MVGPLLSVSRPTTAREVAVRPSYWHGCGGGDRFLRRRLRNFAGGKTRAGFAAARGEYRGKRINASRDLVDAPRESPLPPRIACRRTQRGRGWCDIATMEAAAGAGARRLYPMNVMIW